MVVMAEFCCRYSGNDGGGYGFGIVGVYAFSPEWKIEVSALFGGASVTLEHVRTMPIPVNTGGTVEIHEFRSIQSVHFSLSRAMVDATIVYALPLGFRAHVDVGRSVAGSLDTKLIDRLEPVEIIPLDPTVRTAWMGKVSASRQAAPVPVGGIRYVLPFATGLDSGVGLDVRYAYPLAAAFSRPELQNPKPDRAWKISDLQVGLRWTLPMQAFPYPFIPGISRLLLHFHPPPGKQFLDLQQDDDRHRD